MMNNGPKMITRGKALSAVCVWLLLVWASIASASTDGGTLKLYGWANQDSSASLTSGDTQRRHSKNLWRTLASEPDNISTHSGIVLSAIDAPGVNTTYIELDIGGKKIWIASRITKVERGDHDSFVPSDAVSMENFESRVLKRSFDKIFFVPFIAINNAVGE